MTVLFNSRSSSPTADASVIKEGNSVGELDDGFKERQSSFASQAAEQTLPHSSSLQGRSERNRAAKPKSSVSTQKPRGSDPARSLSQNSRVFDVPVDDNDLPKFCQQPKFTLRDFVVGFAASKDTKDVPGDVVEKSLYSTFTDCGLQKVSAQCCEPRNTQITTQQLRLPDDFPEVGKRVPPKQLLIEMAAVIREQLNKVVLCQYVCSFSILV